MTIRKWTLIDSMDKFTRSYLGTLLGTANDGDDYLDQKGYDIDSFTLESLQRIIKDCKAFQEKAKDLITEENYQGSGQYTALEMAGHDFALTRNGHGAGFWDGDWKKAAGQSLTILSNKFGEVYVDTLNKRFLIVEGGRIPS